MIHWNAEERRDFEGGIILLDLLCRRILKDNLDTEMSQGVTQSPGAQAAMMLLHPGRVRPAARNV